MAQNAEAQKVILMSFVPHISSSCRALNPGCVG
jgi:hypothetical protein